MKILALSDSQLGAGRNLTPDRLADQEAVLDRIAKLAESEQVDLVLHCGDVFQDRHPGEEARLVWKRFLSRVDHLRVLVIAGNHCLRNAELPSAMDLYDGCRFVRLPEVVPLPVPLTKAGWSGTRLSVACLPWVPLDRFRLSLNGRERSELNALAALALIDTAAGLREQCGDGPCLLAGHWMVSGGSLPNGLPVEQLGGPVLPLAELEALGFDAAIFGDVHVPAVLSPGSLHADENGSHHAAGKPIISVGSPALNDWGEEHVPHGVWLLDVGERVEARFVPIDDRRFVTVDIDLTGGGGFGDAINKIEAELGVHETDRVAAAIAEHFPLTDTVLRVRYRATPEQARRVDTAAIRRLVEDAGGHLAKLECVPVRVERARIEGLDDRLPPLEAVALYVKAHEIPQPFADRVGARIARYLEEVGA